MSQKCKRYLTRYRGENLYVIVGKDFMDLSMTDRRKSDEQDNDPQTLVGLGIISKLVSLCLEFDVDREVIAGAVWEESRNKGDLADIVSAKILEVEE